MSEMICFELKVFLVFLLHGAVLFLCSDLLRAWRIAIPHGNVWLGVEDACFWLAEGIWTFVLIFIYQDGVFRLYLAAAFGLGMYLYKKICSFWVVKGVSAVFCLIRRLICSLFYSMIRVRKNDRIRQKSIAKSVEKE